MRARATLSLLVCAAALIAPCIARAGEDTSRKRINMEFKDTPLSEVLETLLKDTGISYTIDPAISSMRVTAVLRNVPFESAIRTVTKAAGAAYRVDGGETYVFTARPPTAYSVGPSPGPGPDEPPREMPVEKITLQYVEPPDVVPVLQMGGEVQVVGAGPSFVMVRGPEEAIERAKKTIQMLDTPDAFPRPVRVKLTATVRTGGQAEACVVTTESVGAEGSPMPLQIRIAVPGKKTADGRPGPPVCEVNVMANVLPTILGTMAGSPVSLAGNGQIEGHRPIEFAKAFEIAASAPPQKSVKIAAGSADAGGQQVSFEVSATATVEEGRVKRPPGMQPQPGQQMPGVGPRPPIGAPGGPPGSVPGGPGPGIRPGQGPVPGRPGPGARPPQGPQGPPPDAPPPPQQ